MAVTLLRALTFLHLIVVCHLETSRSLSEIICNQNDYVFSSLFEDSPAAITTKRRAAFYFPLKPYAVKLELSNFEWHRSHIMGLRWSKHGLTTLSMHGPDPPSDITVFMDVSKNPGPDVSVTTSAKVKTTQQSDFSANELYASLELPNKALNFCHYNKLSAPSIASSLTTIFNLSLSLGSFPGLWKKAKVSPIFKDGSLFDRSNYRPISVLAILSKILERHVHISFYNFLTENDLLSNSQFGFRKSRSCELAVTDLIDRLLNNMDIGVLNGLLLVDLRKAFDLVNHSILLSKLQIYGCSSSTVQ